MNKKIALGIVIVFILIPLLVLQRWNQNNLSDANDGRIASMQVESSTDQELINEIAYRLLASEPIGLDDLVDRRGITPEFSDDISYDAQASLAIGIQNATLVESGAGWRKYRIATSVKESYFWILDIDGLRKLRLFLEP